MSNQYDGTTKEFLVAALISAVAFYTFVILAFIYDIH